MFNVIIILVLSYLVGSIPTSIIVSKLLNGTDIRKTGSGNAGGTNIGRTFGWKYGVLVILLDAFKGVVAVVFLARLHFGEMPFDNPTPFDDFTFLQLMAGCCAVIGHIWTVFAGFKGGKGMATALGMTASLVTVDVLIATAIFILVVISFRYVSLGSIVASISLPIILLVREYVFNVHIENFTTLMIFTSFLALLIVYTHRKNIDRLVKGQENRIKSRFLKK